MTTFLITAAEWNISAGADAPREKRRRVVTGLADYELERAIVLLSIIGGFVDELWLPLLTEESRRRGLPITREN
jgi:hypothetical protein